MIIYLILNFGSGCIKKLVQQWHMLDAPKNPHLVFPLSELSSPRKWTAIKGDVTFDTVPKLEVRSIL
jgi:hypothetical protein